MPPPARKIRIRAQELSDAEAVAAVLSGPQAVAGAALQIPYRSVEYRRKRMERTSDDGHPLVAEMDGRVVAMAYLSVHQPPRRRHCAEIGMAVHDEFQNRGVGTALMEAIIDLADNWLRLRRLELTVYKDNVRAIRLYEKFDFQVEGTAKDYAVRLGHFVDAYFMARIRE